MQITHQTHLPWILRYLLSGQWPCNQLIITILTSLDDVWTLEELVPESQLRSGVCRLSR